MKKGFVYAGLFISLLMVLSMVSAQNEFVEGFRVFWQGLVDVLNTIAQPLFGSSAVDGMTAGEVLFIKMLLFVIVLAIVWSVLDIIPMLSDRAWTVAVISIAVSVLTTRFLATPGWINTIMLPYSALGIALASILPLVIYFYFIEKVIGQHTTLRKTAWILAAVIFVGLFISRYSDITTIEAGKPAIFNPAWIYLITAAICLVFFIMDKTIRRAFVDSEMKALGSADRTAMIAELRRKIAQVKLDIVAGIITEKEAEKMNKEFKKRLMAVESY